MNQRELTSHLLYRIHHRGRWLRPLINFVGWSGVAALHVPVLVRCLDEAVRDLGDGARVGIVFDGSRQARVVVVDDLGAASTIALKIGIRHVEFDGGGFYWTAAEGGVERLTARLCQVVASKLAVES